MADDGRKTENQLIAEVEALRARVAELEQGNASPGAALRESEARLHTVIECLPFDFFLVDIDGRYLMQNSACRKRWGNLIGKRPEDAAPNPELAALWKDNNERAFAGETIEGEVNNFGDGKTYLNVITPIRSGDAVLGILGLNIDITAQKALSDQLQQTQKLESPALLAGGIAHDFNNLLTAILGNVSLYRMLRRSGAAKDDLLSEVEAACERAKGLTQQLLTFGKGGEPVREIAVLSDTVREAAQFAVSGSKCLCVCDIGKNIWPALVDTGQVYQAVNNLVINATQAMPDGGTVEVSIGNHESDKYDDKRALGAGRYVCICVRDHGVGIADSDIDRIFEPYFSKREGGHGLGLAVVFSIVRKHGGVIWTRSTPGQGSAFSVYLPAAESASIRTPVDDERLVRGTGKILVLDDEPALRKVTAAMLEQLGYTPSGVATCDEAVALYESAANDGDPFLAVILDLTIPGDVGGRECVKLLRALDADVKAIVASGYSNDPVLSEFDKHGFVAVLPKPFSVEMLSSALRDALDQSP